ncbi:sigma 54-interacting transcriptional regulator, partial [bacterium]|nr:sigma 54-interacting transcriptional regulator [bacterium]
GAFTGAHTAGKRGLIELAHNGTLFHDEIATLSYPLQAKLLRLISEHEILKLGSDRIIPINVSILAATNVDIEMFVEERHFREDLYYRLSVFRLHIPPLRERPEDLFPLFLHFVSGIRPEINNLIVANRQTVNKVLIKQALKGNARELENVAKRFCLLYRSGKDGRKIGVILEICLEMETHPRQGSETLADLKTALQFTEKQIIQDLLRKHKNKSDVASALNIAPSTLWRKLKKYGIQS